MLLSGEHFDSAILDSLVSMTLVVFVRLHNGVFVMVGCKPKHPLLVLEHKI